MTWLTKSLTLDLLAITIHGLQSAFDRINEEPDTPDCSPAVTAPAVDLTPQKGGPVVPMPTPGPDTTPVPDPEPVEQPAAAETPNPDQLRDEAKTHLREIAMTEGGTAWITDTLFKGFGIQTLTALPDERLPELIAQAKLYLAGEKQAA